ncbi:MAG TPA: hypothetical protein VMW16_16120 [Sedimentisphaerales bacterium]|nr:hypothetical protein [Sedimentisphaerales bacterium]
MWNLFERIINAVRPKKQQQNTYDESSAWSQEPSPQSQDPQDESGGYEQSPQKTRQNDWQD